jgi:2-oxoisovalerate dehydrogenase E1 component alpha subunit
MSSSDDSSAYRSAAAVESVKKLDSPLFRLRKYLESQPEPLWSNTKEDVTKATQRKEILAAFQKAENAKKPTLDSMWEDTFAELERPQREQRDELRRLVKKWGPSAWKKDLEKFEGGAEAFLK